jgi:putative transposase
MIGLPRSTYYRRPTRLPVSLSDADGAVGCAIEAVRQEFPAYGYRRVTRELRRRGMTINHKRVQRIIPAMLCPRPTRRRRWVVTETEAVAGAWYPNLAAETQPSGANQLWVADLTYLRVGSDFAYLAVILDAWSRKVIGYALGPVLDARLPLAALDAALETRRPAPGCVHHSDRGSQYACGRDRERLAAAGLRGSMSRCGNPYDNAVAESFMKTLKHEEVYLRRYRTMEDAMHHLPQFIEELYNRRRLHSSLGYRPPEEFEACHQTTAA